MKATVFPVVSCALVSLCLTSHATISTIGSPVVNPANGHTYYLLQPATWTESQAYAQTLGGNLVTINDAAENMWVYNTFPALTGIAQPSLWIGLNDAAVEGNWVWASGEPVTYTFWAPGEPNNTPNPYDPNGEDYATIRPPGYLPAGSWNDLGNPGGTMVDLGVVFGVVEVVPEPQTCVLLMMGVVSLLVFCRRKTV
ncbi:MAG TPA: C-type lectin domain-containing protein [Candidatus Acidoferrum sp.]|nr:C-type lectin domain-containing protein [Candidatus Acidoferrum sp.]